MQQPRALLYAGAGLTLLGALVLIGGGEGQAVRVTASLLAVLGLLVLALSVWALGGERPGPLLLGGAAVFLAGRMAQIFLHGLDDTLFSALTVANALGTVLLFAGVWRGVDARLRQPAAPRAAPAARPAPPAAPPPARAGSIRPAQALRAPPGPRKPGQSS